MPNDAELRAQIAAQDGDILALQIEVSRIPGPTGHEAARGDWVARHFASSGLETRVDDVGNVIGRLGGDGTPIAVAAHLDTVFPIDTPLEFVRAGPRVAGPGIADNGRGLAAMLGIARVVSTTRINTRPIEFVATVGEEGAGDLRGARHYIAATPPAAFIAIDNAGDDRIVNIALGSRRFRVEVRGPGGHSWNAFGVANPVHAAARAVAAIAAVRGPRGVPVAVTVSRIGGGMSVNSVPADAWFEIDTRSTNERALSRIETEIRDAVYAAVKDENARSKHSEAATVSITTIGSRPAGETRADTTLVRCAVEATRLVAREPVLATSSTDANAAMAAGIPAIAIGGGGRSGATHTTHEWYENVDAALGLQRALTIVTTMASG